MNSNRPSKPNLPNVPKPSKLLAPTRLRQTYFFSSFLILLLDHSINQCEIGSFLTASSQNTNPLTEMDMVRKGFGNEPLKDLTMERKRVEEFDESLR